MVQNLIQKVQSLSPEVLEPGVQAILTNSRTLARLKETLQTRDMEGLKVETMRSGLSLSRGQGPEGLLFLCKYLDQWIQQLKDRGPPAPLVYQFEDTNEGEEQCLILNTATM